MPRVLVTGAAGFIGFHLSTFLAEKNLEVVCVDNFTRGDRDKDFLALIDLPNVEFLEIDLNKMESVREIEGDFEIIFHLAAINGTQNFYSQPFEVLKGAVLPTINLIERFKNSPPKRFVFSSTSETYAGSITNYAYPVPTDEKVPLTIDDVLNPRWSYASGKIASESAVVGAATQFGVLFNIIRYHNIYGPRMGDKHVIPDFIERTRANIFELHGFSETRSFLYIDDAIRDTWAISQNVQAENCIINIGSSNEVTIEALAKLMMTIMKKDNSLNLYPGPMGSVSRRCPDLTQIENYLGHRERIELRDGLDRTLRWYAPEFFS